MKHYVVLFILFGLNLTQIIYPSNPSEKHATLRYSISRARGAMTPGIPTPLNPNRIMPINQEPGSLSIVTPYHEEEHATATQSHSDDYQGLSTNSHSSPQFPSARRGSESSSADGFNFSATSLSSLQAAALHTQQPPTPQEKMRLAIERAKRRRSVSIVTPELTQRTANDETTLQTANTTPTQISPAQLVRRLTMLPSQCANNLSRSNNDDEIIELPQTKDASVETDVINNTWGYVVAGSTSAVTVSTATWGLMCWMRPQRRMFTGFEVPAALFAGQTTAKLFGGAAIIVAGTVAATKFNGWLHSGCHSKQKLLEMKFETALRDRMLEHRQETVQQISDVVTQVKREIDNHRKETREIIGHVVEAVDHAADLLDPKPTTPGRPAPAANPHAAAQILHAAADQATADVAAQAARSTEILPPPPPAEKTKCGCCCIQ